MSGMSTLPPKTNERENGRTVRIAAVGDLHFDGNNRGAVRELFTDVNASADVLALVGDLTTHGKPEQMRGFVEELAGIDIPIVTVLGNHDHEADCDQELTEILKKAGVHVLDGGTGELEGIGFAGTKGFAGGFGRGALAPFGEGPIKEFVRIAVDEALKLENALRELRTEIKVALLHYAPIEDTVKGEPEVIWPFLGSSRLLQPIDTMGCTVVFHGHAHHGSHEAITPAGIPVYNVALPILLETKRRFMLWEAPAADRRRPHVSRGAPGTG